MIGTKSHGGTPPDIRSPLYWAKLAITMPGGPPDKQRTPKKI